MRVLLLSQHYPPEPITRLRDLTRYLRSRGHDVSVVTTFPSYPYGRVYDGYRLQLRTGVREHDADITRVFAVPYRGLSKSMRLASYGSFAASALGLGLMPRRRPDVIYAYHPPLTTGLVAALYNLLTGVPFVYDVQDLWPEAMVAAGMLRERGLLYRSLRTIENFVYRRASVISVLSDGMRRNLVAKGVPTEKVRVISNWGNPDVYFAAENDGLRDQLGWGAKFVITIAGNLAPTHGLETVIETAALLRDAANILFVFVGNGLAKPDLMALAAAQGLANVQFHDQVPEAEARRFINASDAMLVHLSPSADGEFSVPHRIFSYMLCGKPIIAAATGSTGDLISSAGCGWVCQPGDPAALRDLVLTVASQPERAREAGQRGLAAAKGPFNRENLLVHVEQLISSVATGQVPISDAPLGEPH